VIGAFDELEQFARAIREDEVIGPILKKRMRQVRAAYERGLKEVKGEKRGTEAQRHKEGEGKRESAD
jgi:hypothetical protein